jgi:hypothetical protein
MATWRPWPKTMPSPRQLAGQLGHQRRIEPAAAGEHPNRFEGYGQAAPAALAEKLRKDLR